MSASLLLTFVTLSATLLRMLRWVRVLADCTEPESECPHDVQRWFYKHVVRGLVRVDVEVLEQHFSAVCDELTRAFNATAPIQETLTSSFPSSNVRYCRLVYSTTHFVTSVC